MNGDDDNGNGIMDRLESGPVLGENDLIELVIDRPQLEDLDLILERSNGFAEVWIGPDRSVAVPFDQDSNQTQPIDFDGYDHTTLWVELAGHGTDTFNLQLKAAGSDTVLDTITFHRFTSIVVVLGGENQVPADPVIHPGNHGIFELAIDRYRSGYDARMYDEDESGVYGAGRPYDDIVNAVNGAYVGNVSLLGYSHGGGSAHQLSWRLNENVTGHLSDIVRPFVVPYTAYIDAIDELTQLDPTEERDRPYLTQFHSNQYQRIGGNLPNGTFVPHLLTGNRGIPPGEDDIDRSHLNVIHQTIDDHPAVLRLIQFRIQQRVAR